MGFNPTASSHFHVIEYVDVDTVCVGVEIYSSKTTAWIYKESEWSKHTNVTFIDHQVYFLTVVYTLWGTLRGTL